jgi:hypothetical protein
MVSGPQLKEGLNVETFPDGAALRLQDVFLRSDCQARLQNTSCHTLHVM